MERSESELVGSNYETLFDNLRNAVGEIINKDIEIGKFLREKNPDVATEWQKSYQRLRDVDAFVATLL